MASVAGAGPAAAGAAHGAGPARPATTTPGSRPRRWTRSSWFDSGPAGLTVDHAFTHRHPAHRSGRPARARRGARRASTCSSPPATARRSARSGSTPPTGDSLEGRVELGAFPATLQVSPDGYLAYVVNFNLHGDMVPSSVSVVATDEMLEITRIPTCIMPHGSRLNAAGHAALLGLHDGRPAGGDRYPHARGRAHVPAAEGRGERHDRAPCRPRGARRRRPTRAARRGRARHGATQARRRELLAHVGAAVARRPARVRGVQQGQRDRRDRRRRLDADAPDPGRATASTTSRSRHDGKLLVATNKRGQSVSVFDAASGKELKRLPTKRKVVHGVAITPDDRYAFVSVEGIGSQPGTVEVIDLRALATVGDGRCRADGGRDRRLEGGAIEPAGDVRPRCVALRRASAPPIEPATAPPRRPA